MRLVVGRRAVVLCHVRFWFVGAVFMAWIAIFGTGATYLAGLVAMFSFLLALLLLAVSTAVCVPGRVRSCRLGGRWLEADDLVGIKTELSLFRIVAVPHEGEPVELLRINSAFISRARIRQHLDRAASAISSRSGLSVIDGVE